MRLIDADALIKRCMNGIDNEFIGIVNEIPTIDTIPLDEPFINKPCISEGVCHEDKVKVLDKIRAEIKAEKIKEKRYDNDNHIFIHKDICIGLQVALDIIDKYRKEQE